MKKCVACHSRKIFFPPLSLPLFFLLLYLTLDETKLSEDFKPSSSPHDLSTYRPLHQASLHECQHHTRPPLRRQSTLPSYTSSNDPLSQPEEEEFTNLFAGLQTGSYSHGLAERSLRRPQSLCLVLLHLPCMFCARALAPPPPPTINSFRNVLMPTSTATRETCMSEPGTPVTRRRDDSVCSFEPGPCCGDPVVVDDLSDGRDFFQHLTPNVDSNTGRGPSTREESEPRKKPPSGATVEGHLKCHRPRCNKSLPAEEARARFRTCPNCYTYYCSRQCRKLHLARHKDHCPQTRISNLCKQVLMKARDDPISRRHLSLCARRGLLSRGRGAVKLLFLCPEDALDYLVHGWEAAKGQTLYVSRSDLLPQEMGSDVFSQVRNFCDKYNPERKFILLAAITVTSDIAQALDREVVVRGAKMHLSPSLPEDDVQTLILTISKTDPQTGDPIKSTREERRRGLDGVIEQLASRGVDVEKLYPHTFRKITRFVEDNEPFSPISIFPTDQRNGRVFMCIILPWADADIILNISSKGGIGAGKSSKKKWGL